MSKWISVNEALPEVGTRYPVNFISMSRQGKSEAYNGPHVGFYREMQNHLHIFEDTNDDVFYGVTHWAEIARPPFHAKEGK